MQNKGVGYGAALLAGSGIAAKLLGFFFRIPLKNWIGGQGMAYYSVACRLFSAALLVTAIGLPTALSGRIAESYQLGREREIRHILFVSFLLFFPLSVAASAVLWKFAPALGALIGSPRSAGAIRCIAPSVAVVGLISLFRGYYQGKQNMLPTAVSQLAEAGGKLVFGLLLARFFLHKTQDAVWAASGAAAGITIGELVGLGFFLIISMRMRCRMPWVGRNDSVRPWPLLVRSVYLAAWPIMLSHAASSISDMIDLSFVMNRLQAAGMAREQAEAAFGIYNSMVLPLAGLPQTLISALSVSIVPALSGAIAVQTISRCCKLQQSTVRIGCLVAFPCAVGLALLAKPLMSLLFAEDAAAATLLLQIFSPAIPGMALSVLSAALLQGIGRPGFPLLSFTTGAGIKAVAEYFLIKRIGMAGAPLSTALSMLFVCILNFAFLFHCTGKRLLRCDTVGKPLLAAMGMGIALLGIRVLLPCTIGKFGVLLLLPIGLAIYLRFLICLHILRREDLRFFPPGGRIAKLLDKVTKKRECND